MKGFEPSEDASPREHETPLPGLSAPVSGRALPRTVTEGRREPLATASEADSSPLAEILGASRGLLDAHPEATFVFDGAGRLVYLNAAGCLLLGATGDDVRRLREDVYAHRSAHLFDQFGVRAVDGPPVGPDQALVPRLLRGEVVASADALAFRVTLPDGRDVYLGFSGGPVRDDAGAVWGAIVTGRDLSHQFAGEHHREAMRRAFEEQSARVRTLLDLLPAGVAVYNPEGELLEINAAGRRLTQRQVLPGETAPTRQARYEMRHGDGSAMPEDESPSGRARRGLTYYDDEYVIDGAHGPETHILTSAAPLPGILPLDDAPNPHADGQPPNGAIVVFQDVTELRRLELVAREQADLADGIIESSPFGVMIFDISDDFRTLRHNRPYLDLVGADLRARGNLVGVALDDYFDPESAARTHAIFEHVRATGESAVIDEYEAVLPPDPLPRYYRWSLRPLRDGRGKISALVATAVEITREVRSRREAEALARRLETVLDVLPMGIAIVDAEGRILHVNDAFRQVWEGDVPLSESVAGYSAYVGWWPDGRPLAAEDWAMARALRQRAVIVGEEVEIQTLTGRRKVILNNAAPVLDDHGHVTGGVVAFLDITGRRQLEARTREALDALLALAGVLVSGLSPQGADLLTPGAEHLAGGADLPQDLRAMMREVAVLAARTLGCARVAIATIEPTSEVMTPVAILGFTQAQEARWWHEWQAGCTVAERMGEEVAARLRAGEVVRINLEEPRARHRLEPYNLRCLLVAPMRVDGQVIGSLAFDDTQSERGFEARDEALAGAVAQLAGLVVERDRLLREHAEAEARVLALSATNRLMNEFLGIAGHELRTPLTSMRVNAQLAKMTARRAEGNADLPPALADVLARIVTITERIDLQSRRQERLVNDLLDVSRLDAGKLELHPCPVDLAGLAREAVEEQRLLNPGRDITLAIVPGERHPTDADDARLVVEADPDRLSQVITNYLSNALKYSPADQPVEVLVAREGTHVDLRVRDAGPGIPPAAQATVWQRFHRVDGISVQSGSGIGLGLGLFICRELIERHGGTVALESAPGMGSTFSFSLPLA